MTPAEQILALADAKKTPAQIAAALDLSASRVYSVLREHRPDRKRSKRTSTSALRPMVLGLHSTGIPPARIVAFLKGQCTRQYVYRIIAESC